MAENKLREIREQLNKLIAQIELLEKTGYQPEDVNKLPNAADLILYYGMLLEQLGVQNTTRQELITEVRPLQQQTE